MLNQAQAAIASATASLEAQTQLSTKPEAISFLLSNPNLHPQIALAIMEGKLGADDTAALAHHPVAKDPEVQAKLTADKRGRVRAVLLERNGWTPEMRNLTLKSPNRTGEVDHMLLHLMPSMSVEDSDSLAASAGHAFTFAASLRPGTTITSELLATALKTGKPTAQSRALAPYVLKAHPELAENFLAGYRATVAGSSVLLGRPELARKVANIPELTEHGRDYTWMEDAKYGYFALLANPFTPASLVEEVNKLAPVLEAEAFRKPKEHPDTTSLASIAAITDGDFVTWIIRRVLPVGDSTTTVRLWDLPELAAAPALTDEMLTDVLGRLTWAQDNLPSTTLPVAKEAIAKALETLKTRFEDRVEELEERGSLLELYPGSWTGFCPMNCATFFQVPGLTQACTGCDEDLSEMDTQKALAAAYYHYSLPHVHRLDEHWGDSQQAWQVGLDMVGTYQGPFQEFYLLVADTTS